MGWFSGNYGSTPEVREQIESRQGVAWRDAFYERYGCRPEDRRTQVADENEDK